MLGLREAAQKSSLALEMEFSIGGLTDGARVIKALTVASLAKWIRETQ
jgi:hypothetical protein